jgi:hypothetical protein
MDDSSDRTLATCQTPLGMVEADRIIRTCSKQVANEEIQVEYQEAELDDEIRKTKPGSRRKAQGVETSSDRSASM